MCDELIVWVATDEYMFLLKDRYPVIPYNEREQIISSIKYVDRVITHQIDSLDKNIFIQHILDLQKKLWFHMYFKWDDVADLPEWIELKLALDNIGVQLIFLPYTKTTSTTLLIKKLWEYSLKNWFYS